MNRSKIFLAAGPILGAVLFFTLQTMGWESSACWTAAIAITCAVWWIFEPIPIPATSLLPIATFPVLGILTPREIGESYGSPLVLLLLGGFILSTAMASSGAHRRVALTMVNLVGGSSSRRLVLGFMAASALLSMWISNTATTLMLLPVALAVLEKSRRQITGDPPASRVSPTRQVSVVLEHPLVPHRIYCSGRSINSLREQEVPFSKHG